MAEVGSWRVPAEAASVPRVRAALRRFATCHGWPTERIEDLALAVSEALTNVVVHAYREGGRGVAEVEARVERASLFVTVRDSGVGLRPRLDSPGLGVGLALITALADEVDFDTPDDGGTRVVMRFSAA